MKIGGWVYIWHVTDPKTSTWPLPRSLLVHVPKKLVLIMRVQDAYGNVNLLEAFLLFRIRSVR